MKPGSVLSIQIAPNGTDKLRNIEQVNAIEGMGL